jgi:hypothetical protein
LRAGVVGAAESDQEVVAAVSPLRVVGHDLFEEVSDVVLAGVAGVPHVLAVVVPGLEGVVLDGIRSKVTSSNPVSPVAIGWPPFKSFVLR